RYANKAYAIVTDGKLRVGIRNTGTPWYTSQETMWGRFKLTYCGTNDMEAIANMMDNFEKRRTKIEYALDNMEFYFSRTHLTAIDKLIPAAKAATGEAKFTTIKELNDEFNSIYESARIYAMLYGLVNAFETRSYEVSETDPDLAQRLYDAASEVYLAVLAGAMTDEEALAYYEQLIMRQDLGGGYYVQGDLVDPEGNKLDYGTLNTVYPLTKNAKGQYEATFTTQNRANQPNANGRAGVYISCMGMVYKCDVANKRYVTPAQTSFKAFQGAGNDYQMAGGKFNVVFDPKAETIEFETIEYNWPDRVFVVGSVIDMDGAQHRWTNDEMCGLPHIGDGIYEGQVSFFQDPKNEGYLTFTIFTCRASDGKVEYSYKATRSGWTEGRIGSLGEAKQTIQLDTEYTDLVRGEDRQWRVVWDNEAETQVYTVTFDMNRSTMTIRKGIHTIIEDMEVDLQKADGIYTISGMRLQKALKGVNIIDGRKVMIK
ncbi:MAG: hypothetical protein HUK03_05560, partial [Bacteroidaceae bacterium]|nr:hypothetical protein [Bacteroidaceae bacterium]